MAQFFLFRWIQGLFGKEGFLKRKVIPGVIDAVNKVKEADTKYYELVDMLTAIIPGSKDDEAVAKAREALKFALLKVGSYNTCEGIADENEKLKCIVKWLQSITDMDVAAMKWTEIAAHATKYIANDGRLDIAEVAILVKMVYNKNNEPDDDDDNED
jgi:hypothetical protein